MLTNCRRSVVGDGLNDGSLGGDVCCNDGLGNELGLEGLFLTLDGVGRATELGKHRDEDCRGDDEHHKHCDEQVHPPCEDEAGHSDKHEVGDVARRVGDVAVCNLVIRELGEAAVAVDIEDLVVGAYAFGQDRKRSGMGASGLFLNVIVRKQLFLFYKLLSAFRLLPRIFIIFVGIKLII